ncbi:MAG: molybdopterin molybdenumtransferase MoeA, partial [Candidatus Cloacimonetes bacterium]|nr:molybdopterin molybdenumtransferase MoeA [Candidatus Cloacimonadota bacterium]
KQRNTERTSYIPVKLENGFAIPLKYHGSSHLNALISADALIKIERGITKITEGTIINARQI